jgi:hypothetical protein
MWFYPLLKDGKASRVEQIAVGSHKGVKACLAGEKGGRVRGGKSSS